MEVKIDIERYFTEDDIKELVEDEIREYVREIVNDYFGRWKYRNFVVKVAEDTFWNALEKLGTDTMGAIRNQVRKEILNVKTYQLLGTRTNYSTGREEPTYVQKVINEEAEKMRPEISNILQEKISEKVQDEYAATVLTDAFYDLIEPVFKKGDSNE